MRIPLDRFPFRIGRSKDAEHTVPIREVSGHHLEILDTDEGYLVRDLGSRNGTFLNGERITEAHLEEGDILHVAQEEFRFGTAATAFADEHTVAAPSDVQEQIIRETNDLERVFSQRAVSAVFQPIIRLGDRTRFAYEALGRPAADGIRYSVGDLFRIATTRGEGARLSRLFRATALATMGALPEKPVTVFFNLHPAEMTDPVVLARELEAVAHHLEPHQSAVLEIHESAVTDLSAMKAIRARLHDLGLGLAYDDFGAGQSRLQELIEVPPDYLKLDMSLVRDIDRSSKRHDLVRALVSVMSDLGIAVLAEGIEREAEGEVCRELGCQLAQGYFYGRPAPPGS